jgi:hypothetical protein
MDAIEVRVYRHTMETVSRHLEQMGSERRSARTNAGFEGACNTHCTHLDEHERAIKVGFNP